MKFKVLMLLILTMVNFFAFSCNEETLKLDQLVIQKLSQDLTATNNDHSQLLIISDDSKTDIEISSKNSILYIISLTLADKINQLKQCLAQQENFLKTNQESSKLFSDLRDSSVLATERVLFQQQYKQHLTEKNIAQLLLIKTRLLYKESRKKIISLRFKLLMQKQPSVLALLPLVKIGDFKLLKLSELNFKSYLESTTLINLIVFTLTLLVVTLFKLLNRSGFSFSFLNGIYKIDNRHLILCGMLFLILSPMNYHFLKINYSYFDLDIVTIYKSVSIQTFIFSIFIFVFLYFKSQNYLKDMLLILLNFIAALGLIFAILYRNYYEFTGQSHADIFVINLGILWFLSICSLFVTYWFLQRIINHRLFNLKVNVAIYLFLITILFVGMFGYTNFAIQINFSFILISSLLTSMGMFIFLIKKFFSSMKKNHFLKRMIKLTYEKGSFTYLLEIKLLIFFICLGGFIRIFFILSSLLTLSQIPEVLRNFLFLPHDFQGFQFSFYDLLFSIASFAFLNLCNRYISYALARAFFRGQYVVQKMYGVFFSTGAVIIILILLHQIGFDFKDISLIAGGLSLGIAIGLKDILSNVVSSLIIFVNRSIAEGDFISVENIKGYVKKIGLISSQVSTIDKSILMVPNRFMANSIVENFTFGNKVNHKIHLSFLLKNLADDDKARQVIIRVLSLEKQVLFDTRNQPEILLLASQNPDYDFELEVVVTIADFQHLRAISSAINRKIILALQEEHISVYLMKSEHALK